MNKRLLERTTLLVSLATLAVAGCANEAASPVQSARQAITLAELDQQLAQGPTRVEIELGSGLEVREISTEPASSLSHDEHIESRITAIDPAGSITLDLGGLTIGFDDGSRFRLPEDSDVPRDAWVGVVAHTLASGGTAFVRVARLAPVSPQAPSDPTFFATELRLEEESDDNELELNVAHDSLVVLGESEATLTVLGLDLVITSATELYEDHDGVEDESGDDNGSDDSVEDEAGDDNGGDGGSGADDGGDGGSGADDGGDGGSGADDGPNHS